VRSSDGRTPLQLACHHGHLEIVQFFLGDPRTDLASADDQGCTPLWKAARWGHIEIIEWLMASGRDLGDVNGVGTWVDGQELTSLEIAKESKRLRAVSLLERFATNPTATRHEIRVKLGLQGALAAELFAVMVFLCDDLLQVKALPTPTTSEQDPAAVRFFAVVSRLPMELQMVLCHQVYGSTKERILSHDSEMAFKSLTRALCSQPQ